MKSFGNNILLLIRPEYRQQIQHVLKAIIGCNQMQAQESSETFEFSNKVLLGIEYSTEALSEDDFATKAPWFEIKCEDLEETKLALLQSNVKEVQGDPKHFFFQLPGGPVFRLVDSSLIYGQ